VLDIKPERLPGTVYSTSKSLGKMLLLGSRHGISVL